MEGLLARGRRGMNRKNIEAWCLECFDNNFHVPRRFALDFGAEGVSTEGPFDFRSEWWPLVETEGHRAEQGFLT